MKDRNIIGLKFNNLTVLNLEYKKGYKKFYNCQCQCGNKTITELSKLNSGYTKSCGCLKGKQGKNNPSWKGFGDISRTFWTKLQTHAKSRNLEVEISIEAAWNLYLKQNKKCALSGLDLQFNKNRKCFDGNASIDRIDSSKGYIEGNIQWVHKDINVMKQDYSDEYFIKMCSTISNYNR